MIDFVLNALADIYTRHAEHELDLAIEAIANRDYDASAYHTNKADKWLDHRDHEILGQPYNDQCENLT